MTTRTRKVAALLSCGALALAIAAQYYFARKRGAYHLLTQAEGAKMLFLEGTFATAVSNSVLEHIPQVPPVLEEVAQVLRSPEQAEGQPGGVFYFCVPGPNFLPFLSGGRALDRVGLHSLCEAYHRFFNRISRHHHCDGAVVWERRLEAAGLQLVRWWPCFSRRALTALEWGHYLGLPSLVCKKLSGRWVLWPSRANPNLWLTERLVRPVYEESLPCEGAYLFFVARKPGCRKGTADA